MIERKEAGYEQPEIYIQWDEHLVPDKESPGAKVVEVWRLYVDGKHQADLPTKEIALTCAKMERERRRKQMASREYV